MRYPLTAGQPITQAWTAGEQEPLTGYRLLRIGLAPDRQLLYARINARASAMFAQGLVEETRMLMEKYRPDLKLLDALGYRQAAAHLRGEITLEAATDAARQGHRNYAKRQMTWFAVSRMSSGYMASAKRKPSRSRPKRWSAMPRCSYLAGAVTVNATEIWCVITVVPEIDWASR